MGPAKSVFYHLEGSLAEDLTPIPPTFGVWMGEINPTFQGGKQEASVRLSILSYKCFQISNFYFLIFGFTSHGNIVGERNFSRRSKDLNLPSREFVQEQVHTHVYLHCVLALPCLALALPMLQDIVCGTWYLCNIVG